MPGTLMNILLAMTVTVGMPKQPVSGTVVAGAQTFQGEYTISYLGLPVARSTFTSTFNGDQVNVQGNLSSAGVGKLVDSTVGSSHFSGRMGRDGVVPSSFKTTYKSGKKTKSTTIGFSGGDVVKTVNVPPTKKRKKWVPLKDGDLQSVSDPISATLIRAASPAEVCARTIKVYDGEMRANIRLSLMSSGKVPGFGDEAVTCSAKFVPVSGYRPDSSSLEYLKNRAKISISFAPLGDTGIYAPVRASIGTKVGTVTVVVKRNKI